MNRTELEAEGSTVTAAASMNTTGTSSVEHRRESIPAIPKTGKLIDATTNGHKINDDVICLDDGIGSGDSDVLCDDDDVKRNYEGFNSRNVTLQTLMSANVLQPGKSVMTIEYLGYKFVGDLLPDGKIKSQETETVFLTPNAWAMHCKRIINPEKKDDDGWGLNIKYKGKKLHVYQNNWLLKCALQKYMTVGDEQNDNNKEAELPLPMVKRTVYQHNTITDRNVSHDVNMLIEAIPFTAIGKLQPFHLTMRSSALLLADFHCHLTMHEVSGYLGGTWDVTTQTLTITKTYPCRNSRFDLSKAVKVEQEVHENMFKDKLLLVGWYHSHPKFQAEATLKDCDAQLDYQIKMIGPSIDTYTPCVALIISPYYDENPTLESVVKSIWVMPPNEENQALEYGRPMLMQYSVLPDEEIPEEVRIEIQSCVDYYSQFRNEIVRFSCIFSDDVTYIEKLKNTLYPKFPIKQNDKALWNWICVVLGCEQEDDFIPPKTIKIIDSKNDIMPKPITDAKTEIKTPDQVKLIDDVSSTPLSITGKSTRILENRCQSGKKTELKVPSLQEQLCLPSGLNMNPVRMLSPLATPNPTAHVSVSHGIATGMAPTVVPPLIGSAFGNAGTSNFAFTSPRDSPIAMPSNSISPAKFALPFKESPPAKSSTSPHASRKRKSPAPSPSKCTISDITRNNPSITQTNKYDPSIFGWLPSLPSVSAGVHTVPKANNLVQLAEQLPSNFLPTDLAALFQQHKDYGRTSLNQLPTIGAKVDSTGGHGTGVNRRMNGITNNEKQFQNMYANKGGEISTVPSLTTNFTDTKMAITAAEYAQSFNVPRMQSVSQLQPNISLQKKSKRDRPSKYRSSASSYSSTASSSSSYKTKLMKELDELKNDPLKMSELIRSPEYAALLLQQAEALGATTLGSLGFGTDFSYLTAGGGSTSNTKNTFKNTESAAANAAAVSAAALTAEYNNLLQASKLLGYDSYVQQSKNNDLNVFFQERMAAAAAEAVPISTTQTPLLCNTKKQQQRQQQHQGAIHPDYTTLLQAYSKLLDPNNHFGFLLPNKPEVNNPDLSPLLTPVTSPSLCKQKPQEFQQQLSTQSDMLKQLLQSEKQQSDLNGLLYHQNKVAADLNAMFAMPSAAPQPDDGAGDVGDSSSTSGIKASTGASSVSIDPVTAYYIALAQEKIQDYAAFIQHQQQQAGTYSIPDPLSKSTLAANNMFMSPSALLKIQQESLSAMMMKPSNSIPSHRTEESFTSLASERSVPSKSNVGVNCKSVGSTSFIPSGGNVNKNNFNAVDLAISSVSSNITPPDPPEGSSRSMYRRQTNTSPINLSRLHCESMSPTSSASLNDGSSVNIETRKRMKFSSIVDLAAPSPPTNANYGNDMRTFSNK